MGLYPTESTHLALEGRVRVAIRLRSRRALLAKGPTKMHGTMVCCRKLQGIMRFVRHKSRAPRMCSSLGGKGDTQAHHSHLHQRGPVQHGTHPAAILIPAASRHHSPPAHLCFGVQSVVTHVEPHHSPIRQEMQELSAPLHFRLQEQHSDHMLGCISSVTLDVPLQHSEAALSLYGERS